MKDGAVQLPYQEKNFRFREIDMIVKHEFYARIARMSS